MATQAGHAVIKQGPGYETLEIDGEPFPFVTSQLDVQTSEVNPDIDSVVVIIPTLGKVQYE